MKRSPYVPLSTVALFVTLSSCAAYPAWATTIDGANTTDAVDETIVTSTWVDNPLEIAYQEATTVEEPGTDGSSWVGITPEVEPSPTSSPEPTDDATREPSADPLPTLDPAAEASPDPAAEPSESSEPSPEPTAPADSNEPTPSPSVSDVAPSPSPEPSVEPTTEPTTEPSPTSSPAELILPVPTPAETAPSETKTSPVAPYTHPVVNLPTVAQNSPTIPRVATDGMGSAGPKINAAAPGPSVQHNQNNGNVGNVTNGTPVEQQAQHNSLPVSEERGETPQPTPSSSPSASKTAQPVPTPSKVTSQVRAQPHASAPVLVLRYPAPRDYSQLSAGDVQSIFQQAPPVEKVIGPVEDGHGLPITEAKNTAKATSSPASTLVSSESAVAPKEPVSPLVFVGIGVLSVVALGTVGLVITRRSNSS